MMKCRKCGADSQVEMREHHYTESGLCNVWLTNATFNVCSSSKCGEEAMMIRNLSGLHDTIALAIAEKPVKLVDSEIRYLREWLGVSNNEMAQMMGVKKETMSRWVSGDRSMSSTAEHLLRALVAMHNKHSLSLRQLCEIDVEHTSHQYLFNKAITGWTPSEVAQA